ncbi:MAG: hypothetical protein H0V79_01245 [Actinobacteria bacterium]|nr:hypothetical protein [Actinomycetota bacterium]
MIDRYLAELAARLPRRRRTQVLAEAEDHLRQAAEAHGEEEAIRRFGTTEEVAVGFRTPRRLRLGQLLLAAAVASMVPSFYGAPENWLPPAPWPEGELPFSLAWKRDAILVLAALAALSTLFAVRRLALFTGAGAAGLASLTAGVLAVEWSDAVPGAPGWLPLVGLVPGLIAAAAFYSATAPRAQSSK